MFSEVRTKETKKLVCKADPKSKTVEIQKDGYIIRIQFLDGHFVKTEEKIPQRNA